MAGAQDALSSPTEASDQLSDLLFQIRNGEHDELIDALSLRRRRLTWERLPTRVVLLRHGESEGNVDRSMRAYKGDNLLELTERGYQEAKEAGARLKQIVGAGKIFVCLSPAERTQQTYLGICEGGFPTEQVGVIHVDPQIREQEFGNFQDPGLFSKVKAEAQRVGRFYYRRPNGESPADVFDRVNQFCEKLISDGNDALLLGRRDQYETCVLVTHGLTIRLLLMRTFDWSVETFTTMWNCGFGHHITLRKNMDSLSYELSPRESFPPRIPWATREIFVVFKSLTARQETEEKLSKMEQLLASHPGNRIVERAIDELRSQRMRERSRPFTVVDYLAIERPRTTHTREVLGRVVEGHGLWDLEPTELYRRLVTLSMDDVDFIDWWGDHISHRGKMMRAQVGNEGEPRWSVHNHRRSVDYRAASNSPRVERAR